MLTKCKWKKKAWRSIPSRGWVHYVSDRMPIEALRYSHKIGNEGWGGICLERDIRKEDEIEMTKQRREEGGNIIENYRWLNSPNFAYESNISFEVNELRVNIVRTYFWNVALWSLKPWRSMLSEMSGCFLWWTRLLLRKLNLLRFRTYR